MSIIVKGATGSTYTPHPEGQYAAVCVDVQDLGYEHSEKFDKTQYKIRLVFYCGEWTEEKEIEIDGERVKKKFPMVVSKKFTASLHEKSSLRPFAKSWRGADFTPQELKDGFDFERMYGAPALIQVGHFTYEGEAYAGIDSIMRLRNKDEAPAVPPEYTRLKDREDWEGPAPHPNMSAVSDPQEAEPNMDEPDDSLPF
jgi:hypothetical protein